MHYRTPRIGFLETEEAFLELMTHVERLPGPIFDTAELPVEDVPVAVVPAAPYGGEDTRDRAARYWQLDRVQYTAFRRRTRNDA